MQPVTIAEYVWIDATQNTRSKARTLPPISTSRLTDPNSFPLWNFDGSSTGQASGHDSEVILVPRATYPDPFRPTNNYSGPNFLVLCDCYDRQGKPVSTNTRTIAATIFENDKVKDKKPWFGLEQEYVLYDLITNRPLGWPPEGSDLEPQGKYYCSTGSDRAFGRQIVEEHYAACIVAGIRISGINAEVMPGQWEYQIGPCEGISAGDQLWLARYIMNRVAEKHGVTVSLNPKPEQGGDWNGSGCHANYSTEEMRGKGGRQWIDEAISKLGAKHMEHISVYGTNDKRLTGKHETSSIQSFSYGVANRGCSIRIPSVVEKDGCGYFEDRRPASDCDPYLVTSKLAETTILV